MNKVLHALFVFCALGIWAAACLAAASPSTLLEQIVAKKISIQDVLTAGISRDALLLDFQQNCALEESARKKFLLRSHVKEILNKLDTAISRRDRQIRKFGAELKPPARQKKSRSVMHTPYFYGNPDLAVNATDEQIHFYHLIKHVLGNLLKAEEINESTYDECFSLVESLELLHTRNKEITRDFSLRNGNSSIYDSSRPGVHPEKRDLEYEKKAEYFFQILIAAYRFAETHHLVAEMFNEGLSKSSGCLLNRFHSLNEWYFKKASFLEMINSRSDLAINDLLEGSVIDTIYGYIEKNYLLFAEIYEPSTEDKIVEEIIRHLEGKKSLDGDTVDRTRALLALRTVFGVNLNQEENRI
jgi:hypothetical protein